MFRINTRSITWFEPNLRTVLEAVARSPLLVQDLIVVLGLTNLGRLGGPSRCKEKFMYIFNYVGR